MYSVLWCVGHSSWWFHPISKQNSCPDTICDQGFHLWILPVSDDNLWESGQEIISEERTKGDSGEKRSDFLCLSIKWSFLIKIIIPMMFLREIWADTHFERILYRNFGFRILECKKRRYRVRGDQIWCEKWKSPEILHDFSVAPSYRNARAFKTLHLWRHLVLPGKKNVAK